jgi:SAM-dependent methyltransferase
MEAMFAGSTAALYAEYRRDLPVEQAAQLAGAAGLQAGDVLVDLGCGTGQLTAPLAAHCRVVLAMDPEPAMLVGLRARRLPRVVPVLGADSDLLSVSALLSTPGGSPEVGAVVVGNAIHWMDAAAVVRSARTVVRPGGALAVVTQGPPLWLGSADWQRRLRSVLEDRFGPLSAGCGSDEASVTERADLLRSVGWRTEVLRWHIDHQVDPDWVLGHLGSALPADALDPATTGTLRDVLEAVAPEDLIERAETTVVLGR